MRRRTEGVTFLARGKKSLGVTLPCRCLVRIENSGKHDFGYICRLPENIDVDGLLIDDSAITFPGYKGPAVFGTFGSNPNLFE